MIAFVTAQRWWQYSKALLSGRRTQRGHVGAMVGCVPQTVQVQLFLKLVRKPGFGYDDQHSAALTNAWDRAHLENRRVTGRCLGGEVLTWQRRRLWLRPQVQESLHQANRKPKRDWRPTLWRESALMSRRTTHQASSLYHFLILSPWGGTSQHMKLRGDRQHANGSQWSQRKKRIS